MTTRWKKYQIRYSYAKEIDFDDVIDGILCLVKNIRH